MPVYETFSERKRKAEQGGKPVLFHQDALSLQFRSQVIHIWNDTFGDPDKAVNPLDRRRYAFWQDLHNTFAREIGVLSLQPDRQSLMRHCHGFVLNASNVDDVLSLIELSLAKGGLTANLGLGPQSLHDAIEELNHRFRQHAIGYQFQAGLIIPVESQYLHADAVEPAISLLYDSQFDGPLQEFMQAHEHYRKGDNTEAIANAQYAFESTMKAICDRRGWSYGTGRATAKTLLDVLFNNNLIPTQMQSHFTALRSTLESGLPTVRNQPGQGGHGQGSDVVEVPDYLAAYCLHLAATNIVLLIEAHNATK